MTRGTVLPGSGHLDDRQRRIRRSPLLYTTPFALVAVLISMAIWEITRGNLSPDSRGHWPWRFSLFTQEALSSLLAVAIGFVFARAQYARTVRPIVGWNGYVSKDNRAMSSRLVWVVRVRNGGMHSAILESVDYHVQPKGEQIPAADIQWTGFEAAIARLESLGLRIGKDFDLNALGPGSPLTVAGEHPGVHVARLSVAAISLLDNLYIRVRVIDAVGDTHERIVHCLRAAEVEMRSARATDES
ncbi:hypothetical protein [Streptomyces sp. HD]|uniref:hypothetical protein n=1 Tax=Streptomyces sp. HD TaxID=3020892 RepID=UPI00233130C4|nr:hypothetical protein [Streptomyces sp. HD]MDC0765554.1 hypothetical protein [Streptomyces sp. HD]